MNFHDPKEVIEMMCLLTHDANDIEIVVEYETIIIKALSHHNNNFSMRWSYEGYGNERVRQIAQPYHLQLMKVQREENNVKNQPVQVSGYPKLGQEVEFTRMMNGKVIETVKGHVIRIDQDGIIEVHAFNRDNEGKFKYYLRPDEIHKPY